jgi:hypothetical protein
LLSDPLIKHIPEVTCQFPRDKEEGKSKFYLKNWRPISLLNVDYKICASAFALRFKKVLTYLISDTQMGFMKGRFIGECTRLINDIIEKCDENNIPGVLILLDFEKKPSIQ